MRHRGLTQLGLIHTNTITIIPHSNVELTSQFWFQCIFSIKKLIFRYGNIAMFTLFLYDLLLVYEDSRLIAEKRFARPNDPESYAGGSVSSW
jgi:hypothetical protein